MGRVSGAALILAGLGMAGFAMHWTNGISADAGRQAQADAVPAVTTPGAGQQKISAPPAMAAEPRAAAIPATPKRHARPIEKNPVQVVVARIAPNAAASRSPASAGPPLSRIALTKELQRQLTRVGCYQGRISGVWTPLARRSMKAFTDRLNARLPVDQPDHVLLAMLQSHSGRACGEGCPAGLARARAGRCGPKELVAAGTRAHSMGRLQSNAKLTPLLNKQGRTEGVPPPVSPGAPSELAASQFGRMSLAGPREEAAIQPNREASVGTVPANAASATNNKGSRGIAGRQRTAGKRLRASRSGPPAWVPWARPWAMN